MLEEAVRQCVCFVYRTAGGRAPQMLRACVATVLTLFLYRISFFTRMYIIAQWGHAVAQLIEALRYKLEGRGFDFRWCHWIFSLT